jgi:hypothetical protein
LLVVGCWCWLLVVGLLGCVGLLGVDSIDIRFVLRLGRVHRARSCTYPREQCWLAKQSVCSQSIVHRPVVACDARLGTLRCWLSIVGCSSISSLASTYRLNPFTKEPNWCGACTSFC